MYLMTSKYSNRSVCHYSAVCRPDSVTTNKEPQPETNINNGCHACTCLHQYEQIVL